MKRSGLLIGLAVALAPHVALAAEGPCFGTGLGFQACEEAHHGFFFGGMGGLMVILILLIAATLGAETVPTAQSAAAKMGPEKPKEQEPEGEPKGEAKPEEPKDDEPDPEGPRPIWKEPRQYPDGRSNPWDPTVAEQRRMWRTRRVVWDPTTLSWREPRPDELETPPDLPKNTPFQRTVERNKVPFPCLQIYDEYARAQAGALEAQSQIESLSGEYQFAQDELNKQLAKFTLKLGYEVGSIVAGGAKGVHDAGDLTRPGGLGQKEHWVGPSEIYGELNAAIAAARKQLAEALAALERLAARLAEAAAEAAEKSTVLRTLREAYDGARARLAQLMGKSQQMEAKAVQLEGQAARLRELQSLEAEGAQLGKQVMTSRQKLDEIRTYKGHMAEWGKAFEEWKLENNNAGAFKFEAEGLQVQIDARLARTDALTAAEKTELAQWQQRLEDIRFQLREWEKTHVGMEEYIRQKCPESYQYMKNNPFSGTDLSRNADLMAAEEQRLMAELGEVEQKRVRVRARSAEVQAAVPAGETLDATQAKLAETKTALAETRSALQEQKATVDAAAGQVADAETAATDAAARRAGLEEQMQAARAEKEALEGKVKELEGQLQGAKDSTDPSQVGIANRLRKAAANAGKKWEEWFGAEQSPEQVAEILTQLRLQVVSARNRLEAAQKRYDDCMQELHTLKQRFDRCVEEHTFYGQP